MTDSLPKTTKTVRVRIYGRVQGVGYRNWLQEEALELQISGWVRNRTDGTVEAVLHGEAARVDDLIRACHRGPPLARVDKVLSEPAEYGGIDNFLIEKTV